MPGSLTHLKNWNVDMFGFVVDYEHIQSSIVDMPSGCLENTDRRFLLRLDVYFLNDF